MKQLPLTPPPTHQPNINIAPNTSIHCLYPLIHSGSWKDGHPSLAVNGREAGYNLDRLAVHHRVTPKANLEKPINLTVMFLGCGRKPEPREKPGVQKENMESPCR
ncbi:hypothetical protein ILYODFUR_023433 [Ilyodon furcidens]|uniref:Uncharacterized protein n=1 Tax=Ilyodon furcidens TaxID=33524 RepID=A0ABV0VGP0_9TELE